MAPQAEHVEDIPFTKQMRKATRDIHSVSDALINAKLGIALSDNAVWAEGLLVFYDVFAYLESALDRLGDSLVGELDVPGMRRRAAFEADLAHYLGADWRLRHAPRPAVQRYLDHLADLERDEPHLLMAYIYHLYMGLLSGGQVLRAKRRLLHRVLGGSADAPGNAVTDYGAHTIRQLKTRLAAAMNAAADQLDDVTRRQLIDESREVFVRNNEIVATVRGAEQVLLRRLGTAALLLLLLAALYWLLLR
ncbi:heme oxygenase-like isoform X1 [Amphibalanus amphitrite]|uniref:heme oxygenase-like isoform X1 n=1 Tax=Amphibalanus amphitrite TaxID=1232801 RepID=UPI001C91CFB3|nr:heme oxygenase-like isoform X1 [Amphibalanus amphitrite]